jgi:hypothetical protein
MAKGLRSSVTKTNKRALRKRVFGPVEAARTERLSSKLQELAAQPRPESDKMDVAKASVDGKVPAAVLSPSSLADSSRDTPGPNKSAAQTDSLDDDAIRAAEGWLPCFSCSIPKSLSDSEEDDHMGVVASGGGDTDSSRASSPEDDERFYNFLGIFPEIVGFGDSGSLLLSPAEVCFDQGRRQQ